LRARDRFERLSRLPEYSAGVVYEYVDAAGIAARFGDKRVDGSFVRDVDRSRQAPAAGDFAVVCRFGEFVAEHVTRPHGRTARRQRDTDGAAKAMRGTSDDRGFAEEFDFHAMLE
jgi:hypothetical protein